MKAGLKRSARVGAIVSAWVLLISQGAWAVDPSAPVTQEQFREWTNWAKKSVHVLDQRQKRLENEETSKGGAGPSAGSNSDGAVDLNALSSAPSGESQASAGGGGGGLGSNTKMEAYFDLNLINQPGSTSSLAFDSYHNLVFFDITPTPDITFSFNMLGPTIYPLFYELDYRATNRLTLRAGKIWIPFDDTSPMDPHTIFGGRESVKQLMPTNANGGNQYLPSIWTELGVGAKYQLVDTRDLQLETHFCVTNGFTDGGIDPVNPSSTDYPNFAEYSPVGTSNESPYVAGNHRDKSFTLRAHGLVDNTFGLGISYYTGQWNQDTDPNGHLGLYIIGVDAQLRILGLELRGGVSSMGVNLPGDQFTRRGGTYAEAGLPFASKWKALIRGGTLNLDSRIAEATDMTVIGGMILYNPGQVQFSLETNRDIKDPGVAVNFVSYTDLRGYVTRLVEILWRDSRMSAA